MTALSYVSESSLSQSLLPFQDRTEAGRVLGGLLSTCAGVASAVLLALPRGGVPVAYEAARSLGVPMDIFLVRKLGMPHQQELAMGAIASGGVRILNRKLIDSYFVSDAEIESVTARESLELARREQAYRGSRPALEVAGRTAILIDDGLATGSTMRAAVEALRKQRPARVVVAVPVASPEAVASLANEVDEVVSAFTPLPFFSVGRWYRDFSPIMDREIRLLMA